jgi:hypothetical protein
MRDFMLPLRCRRDLLSSEMLRSVQRYCITDVAGQPIGLIQFLEPCKWDRLVLPKRRLEITTLRHVISKQGVDLIVTSDWIITVDVYKCVVCTATKQIGYY